MNSRRRLDDRPVDGDGRDVDEADEDDASYISESSSDIPDSADASELLLKVLPDPPVGDIKWLANWISLLARSLSQQNLQRPLDFRHRPAQGEDDPMHGIHFDGDYHMGDTPEQRSLNYIIGSYRRCEETRQVVIVTTPRKQTTLSLRDGVPVLVRRT